MPALGLFPNFTSPSTLGGKPYLSTSTRKLHASTTSVRCKATASSSVPPITDYDLYDLLGIDRSSNKSQIKNAYRALQKRCHPDIAGPVGHDMAIILNEAYSVLSDPNSRSVYDEEQAKMAEFRGYTGRPLYSMWFGPESERRAVFVDEVKCVGCLKCALFASKTFAIESVYGRARVVAQWADPEDKILDAIQTCPVDCISIIERSDLAALEYLMAKQPRGNVRMTAGNTGGARVSNIFVDVNKFQRRFHEMKDKAMKEDSKESDLQREARVSAMQGIRSISNWWYWQSPTTTAETCQALVPIPRKHTQQQHTTERLREAAAKRRAGETAAGRNSPKYRYGDDEYWTPILVLPSPSKSWNTATSTPSPPPIAESKAKTESSSNKAHTNEWRENPMDMRIPTAIAVVSAAVVGFEGGEQVGGGGLKEHVGGAMVLEIINSFGLQILLAGITWYLIGAAVVGLFSVLGNKRLWK